MERSLEFDQPSACHAPGVGDHLTHDTEPEHPREETRLPTGELPRLFALIQEYAGDDEKAVVEVVAYGLTLPGGTAATIGANGHGFGRWTSARSAARRFHSELVWLGGGDAKNLMP
ncbi:hypothetical protein [Streptosporangium sp. NPDC002721]|uniref:hypothetical protein n=1 Tax=Streptosporangium sp. NPDC002721 TaxID=3366188 RepID=UPI003690481C